MAAQRYLMRGGIVLIVILVLWVIYVSSKQVARNRRIDTEVNLLQSEAEKIRRENETLSEKISYFSSDNFREQEAKEKLGLQKVSEAVVVIKARPETAVTTAPEETNRGVAAVSFTTPNYRQWWQLFFGKGAE